MLRRHLARAYQIHMCSASEEALTPKLECLCGLSAAQEKEGLPSVPRFYWNRSLYFSGSATKAVRGGFGWILRVMSAFFVTLSSLGLVQSLNPAGESEFSVISSQSSAKLSALPGLAALGFSAIGLLLVLPDLKELRTDSDSDEHLGLLAAVILASLSLFVLLRAVISFEGAFTTALPIGGAMMGAYLLHLDRWNVLRQARRKFVGLRESFRLWNRVRKAQLLA